MSPPAEAPARDGFRILSLSGGGYLGLYSAAVLAALEEQAGEPTGRRFDLIAGTSVGGITAAAVAFELPLSHLVRFFVEDGTEIFSPRAKPSGAVDRLLDLSRSVLGPKYDNEALREAEHFMGIDVARVRMLSIGTATVGYQPAEGIDAEAGAVGWLSDGRLILTLIAVQQQHVQAMMEDRLGARYLRLDAEWPANAGLGIDIATPQAAKTLTSLAAQTMREIDRKRLKPFW